MLAAIAALAAPAPAAAADFKNTFSIGPAPRWVTQGVADEPAPAAAEGDAEAYILVDDQVNVATSEHYSRMITEVRTAEGVQDGSTVMAWYDPSFERLVFHHIRVIRDGKATSRLAASAVQLLQREPNLESQMLDGSLTASVVLEDVRPGDRIDVAWTVRGSNPVFRGHYVDEYSLGWSVPVARARVRILCPADRPLHLRTLGGAPDPVRAERTGLTEYLWESTDTAAIAEEDATPSWYMTEPTIFLSEFADWAEVASWARGLYPPAALPPELARLAEQWRAAYDSPADRARAALDWVQQNIRYVGIELGTGAWQPRPPATVASRRFGDCKDQANLLCALVTSMGLEAEPVLVNTWARGLVRQMPASPWAFNHVIVRMRLGERFAFVDPTSTYQRGPIQDRYLPDLGFGLAVATDTRDLLAFGGFQGVAPEVEVSSRFTVGAREEPATLEVRTVARGGAADELREQIATSRLDEIESAYLNYYAGRYPRIEKAADLAFEDDENANVVRSTEQYRVPEFWVLYKDDEQYVAEVYADAVADAIPTPETRVRATPLEVDHPRRIRERIDIELPEPWPGKSETQSFSSAAFDLEVRRTQGERSISLSYDLRTRAAEVAADDVAQYQRDILDIDPGLGWELSWSTDEGAAADDGPAPLPVTIATLGAGLLVAGAIILFRRMARPVGAAPGTLGEASPALPMDPLGGAEPQGLGGWLVFVGLSLALRPVACVVSIVETVPLLSAATWSQLVVPGAAAYNPLWGPWILFELLSNAAIAIASVLMLLLFYQRRAAFPRAFVLLLIGQVAVSFIDIGIGLAVLDSEETRLSAAQGIALLLGSVAWIAYIRRSRRVACTFTR